MTEKRDRPAQSEQPGEGGFEEGSETGQDEERTGKFSDGVEQEPREGHKGQFSDGNEQLPDKEREGQFDDSVEPEEAERSDSVGDRRRAVGGDSAVRPPLEGGCLRYRFVQVCDGGEPT